MQFAPIGSKCLFLNEEVKKSLQLPEILSRLKAQKWSVSC
jgi:hypothetical protein